MDNHKRMFVTSADEDIITNFPEDLLSIILDRLPIKDAVKTSVLSKKWRYRWTKVKELIFYAQFSKQFLQIGAFHHNGFISVINQIMTHHKGPVFIFCLRIPKEIVLDSFQEVDQWMLILSRNNVRVLVIENYNQTYKIPSSVFSCLKLRTLMLRNCIFNPPLEFQGFSKIRGIWFSRVNFVGNLGGTVINLPQLKKLDLYGCYNVKKFNIKARNLQNLKVVNCRDVILLRLLHSKHLHVVYICLKNSIEDSLQVKRRSLGMMLSKLPNLAHFTIDGYFLKFLAEKKFPKWLPHVINRLKQLELKRISFGDLDQLQGVLCMLRNSPNLEVLRVTHMPMGAEADLELTSNYLESPDCLDKTLFMLQTIEITSFEGSRPELLFIKLLLKHSPQLENIIIRPSVTDDAQKMLDVATDVMLLPRASTKAKMVYLDPKPQNL